MNYIIDHLTHNDAIGERLLYAQPYTDSHEYGLDGVFTLQAGNIIGIIRRLNLSTSKWNWGNEHRQQQT